MKVFNKLKQFRAEKKISQQVLADELQIKRVTYAAYETGRIEPDIDLLQKIATYYGVTIDDLIEKDESKVHDQAGVSEVTPKNYIVDRRNQKIISKPFLVPLVPFKARAGYIKAYDQVDYLEELEQYAIPPNVDPVGAVWRYFEIGGDSMEPALKSGDMILCSQVPKEDWYEIRNFYTYVIILPTEMMVKRIVRNENDYILISENEELYDPIVRPIADVKELWVMRRLIKKELPVAKMFDMEKILKKLNKNSQL